MRNYRIIKRFLRPNYEIRETFYDTSGKISHISEDPVVVGGATVRELTKELKLLTEAIEKPVITMDRETGKLWACEVVGGIAGFKEIP
jgi:hypothetical protein